MVGLDADHPYSRRSPRSFHQLPFHKSSTFWMCVTTSACEKARLRHENSPNCDWKVLRFSNCSWDFNRHEFSRTKKNYKALRRWMGSCTNRQSACRTKSETNKSSQSYKNRAWKWSGPPKIWTKKKKSKWRRLNFFYVFYVFLSCKMNFFRF